MRKHENVVTSIITITYKLYPFIWSYLTTSSLVPKFYVLGKYSLFKVS